MRLDKAKVVDEVWDESRIDSFLAKGPMGEESAEFSMLLHAYRSMRAEDFKRFIIKFTQQGHDVGAKDRQGRSLADIISSHTKATPFREILEQA